MNEEIKQEINKDNSTTKDCKTDKEKVIKFDFNPIEVKVKKYNLRFPIDGMF